MQHTSTVTDVAAVETIHQAGRPSQREEDIDPLFLGHSPGSVQPCRIVGKVDLPLTRTAGGGVALMRHALIRLWRLVGLEVKWFVPEGHPAIFDITKRKMHNVLQGVAEEGIELSDEDKKNFEIWTEQNCQSPCLIGGREADHLSRTFLVGRRYRCRSYHN